MREFPEVKKRLGFGMMRLPMIGEDVDIEQVKKIDQDPELYMYMLSISPMRSTYNFYHESIIKDIWEKIIEEGKYG